MRSCCKLFIQETADSCKAAAELGIGGGQEGGYRKIDEPNEEQLKFTRSLGQERYIIT